MVDYFWEYEYKFGEFLKKIFPNTYKRKFSMTGNGIYNLIIIQDKIYEVKFSQTTKLIEDNSALTKYKIKNKIIENITNNLKNNYTVNNGKITFKLGKFIAKIEIIKKLKMPE